MSRSRGGLLLAVAGVALTAACAAAAPAAQPAPPPTPAPNIPGVTPGGPITLTNTSTYPGGTCGTYQVPVTASPDNPSAGAYAYRVTVQLCSASGYSHPVHLLYGDPRHDHTWWGKPGQRGSYPTAATAAGAVTAAVDPPGTGHSTPLGYPAPAAAPAWVLHQLTQDLTGGLFGVPVPTVIEVGAAGGATAARAEAAGWHDVAGVALIDAPPAAAADAAAVHAPVLLGYSTHGRACGATPCSSTQARVACAAFTTCGMAFTTGPPASLATRVATWAGGTLR